MTDSFADVAALARPRPDGLYDISAAAQLVGTHPQTLRFYERRGLIDPARSPGGQRRYSPEHLAQLANIQTLTGEGFNLAAIARIIDLEAEVRALRQALAAANPRSPTPPPCRGTNRQNSRRQNTRRR
jgi:MerR family transcriptional regulator/heat shock protein HspR